MKNCLSVLVVGLSMVFSPSAVAQNYEMPMTGSSSLTLNIGIQLPFNGTLKGNYVAKTNPTGTKTIPGFWGGSGNNPINYSATASGELVLDTNPTGSFVLHSIAGVGGYISDYSSDLLGANAGDIDVGIVFQYSTFHTQNPTAIYPGGFSLPIPLGGGSISQMTVTQNGPAPIIMTSLGGGVRNFTAAIPVTLTVTADFFQIPLRAIDIPAIIPIQGQCVFVGPNEMEITASFDFSDELPLPAAPGFTDQPLDLPTILPPGGTAHLLLTGTFTKGSISLGAGSDIDSQGDRVSPRFDLTDDGAVSGPDLGLMLMMWGSDDGPFIDFNDDGKIGGVDLGMMIGAWTR
ncbi:hypothetical protein LBMAG51_05660 [Phycisphaerae bacterium]|nr:hypothetical protein LBMAG51_05660 [Phycisphaerae bacterium]